MRSGAGGDDAREASIREIPADALGVVVAVRRAREEARGSAGNISASAFVTSSAKTFSSMQSQTLNRNAPPGRSTRCASRKAAERSGKNMAPNRQHTRSKESSSKGSAIASAGTRSMRASSPGRAAA